MSDERESASDGKSSWMKFEPGSFESFTQANSGPESDFSPYRIDGDPEIPVSSFQRFGATEEDNREAGQQEAVEEKSIADLEKEAYEKGFAQGEKDGLERGEERGRKIAEKIEGLFDEMTQLKSGIIKQYEKELIDTVFAIAEKITGAQIGLTSDAVRTTVFRALGYVIENYTVKLRVNPDDANYIEELRPEIFETYRNLKSMDVSPDGSVSRGGCILETPGGDIDAQIETQLAKISDALQDAFTQQD